MILRFLIIIHVCVAFPFKCPEPAQWSTRARGLCQDSSKYLCLKNDLINGYSENCTIFDFLQPGRKHVLRGGLDADICLSERYQPWPITFYTNVSTNCIFLKSTCKEKGQVVYDNGNRNTDANCRCDYINGFDFLVKPRNPCFCVPSEEDCSCYLKACQDSRYVLSPDYECVRQQQTPSINHCKSIIHGRMNSTVNQIDNHDNEYIVGTENISTTGRTSRPPRVFVMVAVLILIIVTGLIGEQYVQILTRRKRVEYIEKMTSGKEIRQYVRIQVIGKDRVGKSSLVQRLLGKHIDKIESTDGIDILKTIQIRKDNGEWIVDEVETERKKRLRRILQIADLNQEQVSDTQHYSTVGNADEINSKTTVSSEVSMIHNGKNETSTNSSDSPKVNSNEKQSDSKTSFGEGIPHINRSQRNISKGQISGKSNKLELTSEKIAKITKNMTRMLQEIKSGKDELKSKDVVECGIWDFAGQKDYYVTHQTFLTACAIYILVTNLEEDLKAISNDENFDSIGDYIEFWFDSIHSCCENPKANILNPPIIMVCTHADKYPEDSQLEQRKKTYTNQFRNIFSNDTKINHKRKIHFISNTNVTGEIDDLKQTIHAIASEMKYFQTVLDTHWIQLEDALDFITNDLKEKILSMNTIQELAKQTSIPKKELPEFLKYQHSIGNIIFFEDMPDYIILQPIWLIKCFRCLVCNYSAEKINKKVNESEWNELRKTGKLSDSMISNLFEKEDLQLQHQSYILDVMAKFDIIVKPRCGDLTESSYYIPCMIEHQKSSLKDITDIFGVDSSKMKTSPWLILEFDFFPFAYFNHILVSYIRDYTVCGKLNEDKSIYGGKAVFLLDKNTKSVKFIVCYLKNAIALQVWDWSENLNDPYKQILKKLSCTIIELDEKIHRPTTYKIAAKCNDGNYLKMDNRVYYDESKTQCSENGKYFCEEHNIHHRLDGIENTWFKHVSTIFGKPERKKDDISLKSKSAKFGTKTNTINGETRTTLNVEETFTYSDGRSEVKNRELLVEGPPPTKEQIQAFVNSDEKDLKNLSLSSKSNEILPNNNHKQDQPPGDYAEQALKAHNGLRAKHGVPALKSAADLCAMAQKWADHLLANNLTGHSPRDHRPGAGENIAYMIGTMADLDYSAKDATSSWYSEIKNYGSYYGKEPPEFGRVPAYGHFTQVVWKDTKEMGIGKAKGNGRVVVVANYRPAGNFIGSYSQNVLPPH